MASNEKTALLVTVDKQIVFPKPVGSSWLSSSFILANILLGVGLLNFPAAYSSAGGLAAAIPIQMVSVMMIVPGLLFVAYCSDLCERNNLQDVVRYFGGQVALIVCNVFIFIHNFGTCITLLVIVADQIDQVVLYAQGPTFCQHWYLRRGFTLPCTSLLLVLPCCFPKRIDSFKFASVLGVLSTLYLMGLIVGKYATTETGVHTGGGLRHWTDFFKVVPTILFSFEAHIEAVPMYSCLKNRNLPEFGRTIMGSLFICVGIYTFVGVFGYLTFGDNAKTDLLIGYYPADIPTVIAQGMVGLKAVMTYPVVFYCARLVVVETLEENCCTSMAISEKQRRYTVTIAMFLVSLIIAVFVPNIGSVIALLGGSASLFIFVFPGFCFMKAHLFSSGLKDRLKMLLGCAFIVFGFFITGTTFTESIMRYGTSEFSGSEILCSAS